MKICPTCRKTYTDNGLNFCLDDGSVLTLAADSTPETVMMNQARFTDPNTGMANQPGIQSSFGNQAGYSMQSKKSSKTWIWVLAILGLLGLFCGGGFIGLAIFISSLDTNTDNDGPTPSPTRRGPTPTPFPRNEVKNIDLEKWVSPTKTYGNTSFAGGEFFMSSKQKGYYYVVAAPDEYKTELATTTVTLRNVDDAATNLGYGLVFHSEPKPLQKGYAFLLDTRNQRYRVVRHEPGKEVEVVNWTNSSSIKSGTSENTLEVRDTSDRVELYINGDMVTTIKNTHGYRGGVVGLYTGDAVSIAFKELEIAK